MTDLKELIGRIEVADGPDRELAVDVFAALGFEVVREAQSFRRRARCWSYLDGGRWKDAAAILSSIDAALALTDRMLTGWSLQLYRHPDGAYATLYRLGEVAFITDGAIERRVTTPYYEGIRVDDAQAPLAILAALLRALQEQET